MDDETHRRLHDFEEAGRNELARFIARLVAGVHGLSKYGVVPVPGLLHGEQVITICEVRAANSEKAALEPLFIFSPELVQQVQLPPCMNSHYGLQAHVTLTEIKHPRVQN